VFARHAKVTYRNGVIGDSFQAYYKQTMFNVWRLSESDLFVVGDEGALYEMPHVSREELSDCQGQKLQIRYLSNASKQDICDRYLLQYGTFVVDLPNGQVEFVVLPHGDKDWKDDDGKVHNDLADMVVSVNKSIEAARAPGVLLLGEIKDRLNYLRDDEAWARKEQRWQWAIKSSQSPTETPSEPPSESV